MKTLESRKEEYLSKKLVPIEVKAKSISQLVEELGRTGFQGRKLAEAVDVWEEMLMADDMLIMMGYAGSLSTTGQWKIIKWLIENRFIDVLVSTGANVSEDLVEAMGASYWQGSPHVDDADLRRHRIYRFHDVYVDEADYIRMEELISEFMLTLDGQYNYSSAEFLFLLGNWLDERGIDGIVTAAYRSKVPVYAPAIVDSAYGVAYILCKNKRKDFVLNVDQFKGYEELLRIKLSCKDSGIVLIGGGVPKDIIQLSAVAGDILLSGDVLKSRPHKHAIQITTDAPHWGGLSGATFEEAVSWGKETPQGKNVQCYCDATIALPIIVHALAERVKARRKPPDLSWIFDNVKGVYIKG